MSAAHQTTPIQTTLAQQLEQVKQGYAKLESLVKIQKQDHNLCFLCLCGGTNTGKSSLFNLLLGKEVSAAKATASATKSAVVSVSDRQLNSPESANEYAWLNLCAPLNAASDPLQIKSKLATDPKSLPAYIHSHTLSSEALKFDPEQCLVLIDTPDHDSHRLSHRQTARLMLEYSDLCIYVTSPQKYKLQTSIDELIYILGRGIKVGVLFNMLAPHQELDLMWKDLQEHLAQEINSKAEISTQQVAQGFPNELVLLGSLPVIHGLSQVNASEKNILSQEVYKALNVLFESSAPYRYILNTKRKQSLAQLHRVQFLLKTAQELEKSQLQKLQHAFTTLLNKEIQQANLLDQNKLKHELNQLLKLHFLIKICSESYLLRGLYFLKAMKIKYKINLDLNLLAAIQKTYGYQLQFLSYAWEKLIKAKQPFSPSFLSQVVHKQAIDLSTFHQETLLLQKLNQQVHTWSEANGEVFLRAFVNSQADQLNTTSTIPSPIIISTQNHIPSLSLLIPHPVQSSEPTIIRHDLICLALAVILLVCDFNWLGILLSIFLCSLLQTFTLSMLRFRDFELKSSIGLNLEHFFQRFIQAQVQVADDGQTNTWWQVFKNQQEDSAELQDLAEKIKLITHQLDK